MKPMILAALFAANLIPAFAATSTNPAPAGGVTVETSGTNTATVKEPPALRAARMAWWPAAKFGLFIQWGVCVVPARKYGDKTNCDECIMNSVKIPVATYREFAAQFNPVNCNPDFWAKSVKAAAVDTAKLPAAAECDYVRFYERK